MTGAVTPLLISLHNVHRETLPFVCDRTIQLFFYDKQKLFITCVTYESKTVNKIIEYEVSTQEHKNFDIKFPYLGLILVYLVTDVLKMSAL
jgi:hypothetical protein